MSRIGAVLALTAVALATPGLAQQPPDFEGRYIAAISDGDMRAYAYIDGQIGEKRGADQLALISLPLRSVEPTARIEVSNSVINPVYSIANSPDGNTIFVAETATPQEEGDTTIRDLQPGTTLRAIEVSDLTAIYEYEGPEPRSSGLEFWPPIPSLSSTTRPLAQQRRHISNTPKGPRVMKTAMSALIVCLSATVAHADDLQALSTGFDNAEALEAWSEHLPEGFTRKWQEPRIEDGQLVLEPVSSGWFEDNQAGHLYHHVTGDFIATTRIEVVGTNADLPQTSFSLGGLFIRAPREVSAAGWTPGQENWLFFSVGTAAPAGEPHYELKTTTNSLSTLQILPAQTGPVDLRIARHGEIFTLLARPEGQEWAVVEQIIRPDLPLVLNVGLTAYADYDSVAPTYPNYQQYNTQGAPTQNADLIAYVDSFDLRRPATGRLPIANIDAPAFLDVIADRRADVLSD